MHFRLLAGAMLVAACPSWAANVVRVDIDGVVHPITSEIVSAAIKQASDERAAALLVRLDTPGGLMDATREIVQKLVASPVPVITYVAPQGSRAASAGFFILIAGDVAAMAPGTRTGAASPVLLGQEMDPVMRKKVESDAAAWIRSIAERRGRNAALAEKTITEAKSFTEREALEAKLIDVVAPNEAELLRQLDKRAVTLFDGSQRTLELGGASIRAYEPTLRQKVFQAVANPNIAFVLVILGALALYIEFTTPGAIFPGVAGAIMLLIGLSALSVLPINWLGAALILLAIAFFVAEAFVTSHGVLGVGGAVALVFGAVMLIDAPPEMRISWGTAIAVALPFAVITGFLAALIVRSQRRRVTEGDTGLVGKQGVARTPIDLEGKIYIHGEYWDAASDVPIAEGSRVVVVAVDGLRLRVRPES